MNSQPAATPPSAEERRQRRVLAFSYAQRLSLPERVTLAHDFDPGPDYDAAPEHGDHTP